MLAIKLLKLFCILLAAAVIAVLLWGVMIMPRLGRRPLTRELMKYRYAHRGLYDEKSGVPENSLTAFRFALGAGYASELDVHLSKDGRLVVMHDADLSRMCGLERFVEDMTADELGACRLNGTEERIPYLEEVLALYDGRLPLLIELKTHKGNASALSEATVKLLDGYKGAYCVESFDPRVLIWMKKNRPQVIRGQLAGYLRRHDVKLSLATDFILRNMLTNFITKPDFVSYCVYDRREPSISLCRFLWRVPEFSWTVQGPKQCAFLESEGCTVIFEGFTPPSPNPAGGAG